MTKGREGIPSLPWFFLFRFKSGQYFSQGRIDLLPLFCQLISWNNFNSTTGLFHFFSNFFIVEHFLKIICKLSYYLRRRSFGSSNTSPVVTGVGDATDDRSSAGVLSAITRRHRHRLREPP